MQFGGFTPQLVTASAGNVAIMTQDLALITTPALSTASGAFYTLTVQASQVKPNTVVLASVGNGTNSTGQPGLVSATVSATAGSPGTISIVIENLSSGSALNGTLVVAVALING